MHFKNIAGICLIGLFTFSCKQQNEPSQTTHTASQKSNIFPRGEKITNENFTGTAYLQMLIEVDSLNSISVGNVTFEPGARTKWHLHPGGQVLLVTEGTGYYQEKGSSKRIIKKGDVIKCPPKVPHWHGASKGDALIHIAVTNTQNGPTVWMLPVSDEVYNNSPN